MIWVISIAVIVIINYFVADEMKNIVESKGYDTANRYFWFCLLLGLPGWIMVAALPNKRIENLLAAIEKAQLQENANSQVLSVPVQENETFFSSMSEKTAEQIPESDHNDFSLLDAQNEIEITSTKAENIAIAIAVENGRIKCSKCGEEQNSNRSVCWECGAKFVSE